MTSPKHATDTDNGRYYQDPTGGPPLPSVTNCIDHGSGQKTPALIGWTAKVTTDYAWNILPRMVAASRRNSDCRPPGRRDPTWAPCGACKGCVTRDLKDRRTIVRDTASDRGTRIHDHAEAHLTGRPLPPDDEVAPYLAQYERFLTDFSVDIREDVYAAEATVWNREVGYAGTLDVLAYLHLDGTTLDGTTKASDEKRLWLIDLKTSETKPDSSFYPDQSLQLAALRCAHTLMLPDDTEHPMPKVAGQAILNLRTDSYGFIPVPVNSADFVAFRYCVGITEWSAARSAPAPKPVLPTGAPKRTPRAARKTTTPTTKETAT